ncbi:MAG: hypothetical protein HFI78_10100 [Lachnospiraceae bacterium]|jgi:isoamylase|nr:hypothetical protein [Lachnospiraceae bacterium]
MESKNRKWKLKKGAPYPLGMSKRERGINIAVSMKGEEESGMLLYEKKSGRLHGKIPFPKEFRRGDIYCVFIEDFSYEKFHYNFYTKDHIFVDPYAKKIAGNEVWGRGADKEEGRNFLRGAFYFESYDWEGDEPLSLSYEESLMYLMHIRGFSRHASSKCENKGTFLGVIEKIPHLKDLGIHQVELMPIYEFEEIMDQEKKEVKDKKILEFLEEDPMENNLPSMNYWGFVPGYYFAPKASYGRRDSIKELKDMIKELHKNKIEVILQFYFSEKMMEYYILDVMKYWVLEYHIDGVHFTGGDIPLKALATDPLLSRTKILYEGFPMEEIYKGETPIYRNLAEYNDAYMYDMRKMLKGDEDQLKNFVRQTRKNYEKAGVINYLTNYNTFTFMDMVSYIYKHNEANLEGNRDGRDYNASWNCGVEGKTKKKSILKLRKKQIRNGISILMLSQGTPLIVSGDEFGNSQKGNNNPYCQDNEISWLNWRLMESNRDIYQFMKQMIELRREHPILHTKREMEMFESAQKGFPDVSYHSEAAWFAKFREYDRYIGIMYSGKMKEGADGKEREDFFYVAYNFHWNKNSLALPKLPRDRKWHLCVNTDDETGNYVRKKGEEILLKNQSLLEVPQRTVMVLIGR